MKSARAKHLILLLSGPFVIYAVLGGFLGSALARDTAYRYLSVFQDVVTLIMNNYVDPVQMGTVIEGGIRGMMDALDPDSAYLSPAEFAAFEQPPAGVTGIGVEVTKRYYLQVVGVLPGSAADKAGLQAGDLLKSVGGVNTREVSTIIGESLLRGEPGTRVDLEVIRGRQADPIAITVERSPGSSDPVAYKMLTGNIGYIRVVAFQAGSGERVARAIQSVKSSGATSLVVDARDSFGRMAGEGAQVAGLFVSGGVAAVLQNRSGESTDLTIEAGRVAFDGPMTLLVNRGTSGAAEILGSAIRHAKRGDLVGEQTAGRGGIQKAIPLKDGSGLVLSVSQYSTPGGETLLGTGLAPTVEVEGAPQGETGGGDPILEKAIEILSTEQAKAAA
ncbi:MAG TPA: S41 family peptidase [Vicinamibacteria bacterium]